MKNISIPILCLVCGLILALPVQTQEPEDIQVTRVTDKIHMLSTHSSGNVGAILGEDGTFIVDDKYAVDGPNILKALTDLGGAAPSYLVNTHYHGDHSGGNEFFGEKGALIVAHKNVRKKLQNGYEIKAFGMVAEPSPAIALPTVTYDDDMRFHLNGENIHLVHVANAHTDGDTIVHFVSDNVIHTGDTFFNGFFPFIDTDAGGSLSGVIKALEQVAGFANDETKIIPGHGPLAKKGDVLATITMLGIAHERLSKLQAEGASLEEVVAAKPLTDIEEKWGGVIFTADQWIGTVWNGL